MPLSETTRGRLVAAALWVWALALCACAANQLAGYPVWKPPLDRMVIGLVENLRDLKEIPGGNERASLERVLGNLRRARIEKAPVPIEQALEAHLAKPDGSDREKEAEALHAKARKLSAEWLKGLGDFVVVPLLADALGSDSASQRREAYGLLLELTEDLPGRPTKDEYSPAGPEPLRAAAQARWRDWVHRNKDSL
ncbi:MAG: hypothetical protein AAB215_03675 [Planctomycetota bacterium]